MPAPPVVHALISLNEPEPRCGAAGLFLAAAIHREYVTCADCLKTDMAEKAPSLPQDQRSVPDFRMVGVKERDFLAQVLEAAKQASWLAYHTHDSRRSAAGFPDLILVKPGFPIIFSELKTAKGKVSKAQRHWLETLAQGEGVLVCLWRPGDLPQILDLLKRA